MNEVISKDFRYPTLTSKKKKWYWTIKCEKCGKIVEKVYQKATWNYMCNACGKGRFTNEDFISKAISVHGDRYSYDNVVYVNNDTKVSVTCKEHGDWLVRPSDFLSGGNCPKCSKIKTSKELENTIFFSC